MPHGRCKRRGLIYLLVAAISSVAAAEQVATYSEDAVKAAFLYRFTGYVEWPPEALEAPQFTIAVMGAPGVAEELSQFLSERSIKDKPANLRVISKATEVGDARLLFIGNSYRGDVRRVIEAIDGEPVLVVTDADDGLDHGATVNFVPMDRRVRFEISLVAAERAKLKIGSELLSVAARIRGGARRSGAECTPAMQTMGCRPLQARARASRTNAAGTGSRVLRDRA